MAIYIKVNNTEYPAAVSGVYNDHTWNRWEINITEE